MTEIISWFCLVVICVFGLIRLLTGLYYHDHPEEYAKKRRIEHQKDPDIWWEEQIKIRKEINQNEKEYLYDN